MRQPLATDGLRAQRHNMIDEAYLAHGAARMAELDQLIASKHDYPEEVQFRGPVRPPVRPQKETWEDRHRIYVAETGNLCKDRRCVVCHPLQAPTKNAQYTRRWYLRNRERVLEQKREQYRAASQLGEAVSR